MLGRLFADAIHSRMMQEKDILAILKYVEDDFPAFEGEDGCDAARVVAELLVCFVFICEERRQFTWKCCSEPLLICLQPPHLLPGMVVPQQA